MKRAAALGVALCLLVAPAFAAGNGGIVVVCDVDVAPYRVFLESFTKACSYSVRVIPPPEAARDGFEEQLRREGVHGIVAVGMQARVAVERLYHLPVLVVMAPQVDSWVAAQPNRFGIEMALPPGRHLEAMRRIFPRARRIGLLFDPRQSGAYVQEAQPVATRLGLTLVSREVTRAADVARQLEELRGQADVIWLLPDPTVLQAENLQSLLLASFESRIPLYAFARKYVELGSVAATHLDPAALGVQSAEVLDCRDNPSLGPARWQYAAGGQLIVNQKIARKMGIDLDADVLESADDVLR